MPRFPWHVGSDLKYRAILRLGGKCVNCGTDDIRILNVNHKQITNTYNSISVESREKHGFTEKSRPPLENWYKLILSGEYDDEVDVRCNNCNILYEYEIGRRILKEGFPIHVSEYKPKLPLFRPLLRTGGYKRRGIIKSQKKTKNSEVDIPEPSKPKKTLLDIFKNE